MSNSHSSSGSHVEKSVENLLQALNLAIENGLPVSVKVDSTMYPLEGDELSTLHTFVAAFAASSHNSESEKDEVISTQAAAELLGVSRPTVVRLMDSGELAHIRVGTHRKTRRSDVVAYREMRTQRMEAAMDEYFEASRGIGENIHSFEEVKLLLAEAKAKEKARGRAVQ